ncbi:MAG: hypothetical protein IIC82_06440 [Chloroflexi bacterium]|nr:hypothetical protein [Chloroflexota bacterium]
MAKQSGLLDNLYIAGYDLSGDVGAVQTIRRSRALLDNHGINKDAMERINGLIDGELGFNSFFNDATDQEHDALKTLLATDRVAMYFRGTAIGNEAAALIGKQTNYDWERTADGGLIASIQVLPNGFGLEFCEQLTAGKRTDSNATNGASLDGGASQADAVNITSSSVADPTVITAAADHGLVTGDSVLIAGHSGSTPSINGDHPVTRINDTTYTIPVNVTVGGTGGTSTKTSTSFGLSAYLNVFAFTGTSVTVKLQDSADDSTFADITDAAFAAATDRTEERIETGLTAPIRRYVRAITTGTFSNAEFALPFNRYLGAL